jgi:monoterpene epsilon-lactone hydrolase
MSVKKIVHFSILSFLILLVLAIFSFAVFTIVLQNDTGGIAAQYQRNDRPSFLSTFIYGILTIKKQVQPLTLASLEASNESITIKKDAETTIQTIQTDGINLISVCDHQADEHQVIFFIHGGAFAAGLDDRYVTFASVLSHKTGYCVLLPDFGRLPSNHYPIALNEVEGSYEWLLQNRKPASVVLGGDSSGADLSGALIFLLEQKHMPLPASQFLLSPVVDLTLTNSTYKTRALVSPLVSPSLVREAVKAYVDNGTEDLKDPLLSPLYGNFHNYPPTIIEVGSQELAIGDAINMYKKITGAGGKARLDVWKGLWHVFPLITNLPEANESLDLIAHFIHANS